jgi:hypothetical protein
MRAIRSSHAPRARSLLLLCAGLGAIACSGAVVGDTGRGESTGGEGSTSEAGDETAGVCGDGVAEGAELCDGNDLRGQSCPAGGTLVCTALCTLDTTGCTFDPTMPAVRFNEVVSDDVTAGPFRGAVDAIELYNAGGAVADLSGWQLSDDPTFPDDKTYTFPPGASLASGERLVLVQLDEATGMGDYPFGISASEPESLALIDADGTIADSVSFAGTSALVSWCRIPDGDGEWQECVQSLGELNATAVPSMGVVLNELTASGGGEIEIHNFGRTPVDLSAYILTAALADPRDPYDFDADLDKRVFAPVTVLDPGERLVIVQGGAGDEHPFGLDTTGDAVTLLTPGLVVVDFVAYGDGEADESYCRLPDGPRGEWTAGCTPTFGDPNAP